MNLTAFVGVLFASLITLSLSAQPPGARKIAGKVFDQTSNSAVPGATITVKGTKNSVQADLNGEFVIVAASSETLVISQFRYSSKEVKVGNSSTLSISLSTNYGRMDDVVVVGYGRMKKSDLSAAVGTISHEDLK